MFQHTPYMSDFELIPRLSQIAYWQRSYPCNNNWYCHSRRWNDPISLRALCRLLWLTWLEILPQQRIPRTRFEARPSALIRCTFSKPHPPSQNSEGCSCNESCTGGTSGRKIASAEDLQTLSLREGASGKSLEITRNHSKSSKIVSAEDLRTQPLSGGLWPAVQLGWQDMFSSHQPWLGRIEHVMLGIIVAVEHGVESNINKVLRIRCRNWCVQPCCCCCCSGSDLTWEDNWGRLCTVIQPSPYVQADRKSQGSNWWILWSWTRNNWGHWRPKREGFILHDSR